MKRCVTITVILLTTLAVFSIAFVLSHNTNNDPTQHQEVYYYTYEIVNSYPHDPSAFTQGLVIDDGILYESTGLRGHSTVRRVNLENGEVTQQISLSNIFFGEGLTVFKDKIIQLTWTSKIGFVYDKITFDLLQTFNYTTQDEGWGITHNGSSLIMSDGTSTLYFLDPQTFQTVRQIDVHNGDGPVDMLNELEYINGSVYANIWQEDTIVIINPQSGNVTGQIDLTGLKDLVNQTNIDVLNGIAYDQTENRLFVTGKLWSKLFEIKLVSAE